MRSLLLIFPLLAACAHTPETPYDAVKRSVDSQITYTYYTKHDYRVIPEGVKAEGNCAVFAATYCDRLNDMGIQAAKYVYETWAGQPHVVCLAGDIILDNQSIAPRKINRSQMKGMLPAEVVKEWKKGK